MRFQQTPFNGFCICQKKTELYRVLAS